jgi:hypothetical protein
MTFKLFDPENDIVTLRSGVNEVVDITGSIFVTDANVKFYKNIASSSLDPDLGGYFQTFFDSSPTSSLSTGLFDLTFGIATGSAYNVQSSNSSSQNQKVKIYKQMASVLLGDREAHFTIGGVERKEALFICVKRNIFKDEIKKGSVSLILNSSAPTAYSASDDGANDSFKQTIGGDYAPLKYNGTGSEVGQVWYDAGIIVLHPDTAYGAITIWSGSKTLINVQSSGSINNVVDGFRKKTERIVLHNQVNICSTSYYVRARNKEFNYSSNPTFTDDDTRIRVTSGSNSQLTRTYITTVALCDGNGNILAVGKLNKPVVKSPENEAFIRVRLDY